MTEGEKMIWAAAYAAQYVQRRGQRHFVPSCIETGWKRKAIL